MWLSEALVFTNTRNGEGLPKLGLVRSKLLLPAHRQGRPDSVDETRGDLKEGSCLSSSPRSACLLAHTEPWSSQTLKGLNTVQFIPGLKMDSGPFGRLVDQWE